MILIQTSKVIIKNIRQSCVIFLSEFRSVFSDQNSLRSLQRLCKHQFYNHLITENQKFMNYNENCSRKKLIAKDLFNYFDQLSLPNLSGYLQYRPKLKRTNEMHHMFAQKYN